MGRDGRSLIAAEPGQAPRRALTGQVRARSQEPLGNQQLLQLMRPRVAAPDAPSEREAAAIAGQGMANHARLAPQAAAAGPSATGGSGDPLLPHLQREHERSLGADLSNVRIHDDAAAHALTRRLGAQAATLGSHVYFGRGRFAPETHAGRAVLRHELVHTLQPAAATAWHRQPEGNPEESHPLVIPISAEEYEQLTGQPASMLPDSAGDGRGSPAIPAALGTGSMFTPKPNWFYRALSSDDAPLAQILAGANLYPHPPLTGPTTRPEMTFRQMRVGGDKMKLGVDRVSLAEELQAFQEGPLNTRGTGELARVDMDAARRMGAKFLENPDILADLDEVGRNFQSQLDAARKAGRGKNAIQRLEDRLASVEAARENAIKFKEAHGLDVIPSRSISEVAGSSLPEAAAGEARLLTGIRYVRYGGEIMMIVGVAMSIDRIASASPEERPRVVAEEAGGWGGSLAAGAAGARMGAAFGGVFGIESGPGALLTSGIGALIGGALGFIGGQEAVDWVYDKGEQVSDMVTHPDKLVDTSTLMFSSPEEKRAYCENRKFLEGAYGPSNTQSFCDLDEDFP